MTVARTNNLVKFPLLFFSTGAEGIAVGLSTKYYRIILMS
jgi:hypothetical protein